MHEDIGKPRYTKRRKALLWIGAALIMLMLAIVGFAASTLFQNPRGCPSLKEISFADFLQHLDEGQVRDATLHGQNLRGSFRDGCGFSTFSPDDRALIDRMRDKGVVVQPQP